MKILYIDFLSPKGHRNFNRIYLTALLNEHDVSLDIVMTEKYLNFLCLNRTNYTHIKIPASLSYNKNMSLFIRALFSRFHLFFLHLYLRLSVDFSKYDLIIYSSFDNIVSSLFSNKTKCLYICHNNVHSAYKNSLHKKALIKISKNAILGVFSKNTFDFLIKNGVKRVKVLPHGLPEKYLPSNFGKSIPNITNFFFMPTSSDIDEPFLSELYTETFNRFLLNKNLFLIAKGSSEKQFSNIIVLDKYISQTDYEYYIRESIGLIIPYSEKLLYRTSGIIMEAIANNKLIILKDIPNFSYIKSVNQKGIHFFSDFIEFKKLLFKFNTINDNCQIDYQELFMINSQKQICNQIMEVVKSPL